MILFFIPTYTVQLLHVGPGRVARYEKYAVVDACHRTSNEQEHKIIRGAGPERDRIFHLRVTECRGQGSHRHDERLLWVASPGQGCSSFVSKIIGSELRELTTFFVWLINSPCALTGSNL